MSAISIDYEAAMAQASQLDRAANLCSEAIRNLKKQRGGVDNYWQGNAGKAMENQLYTMEKRLAATERELGQTAADIRRIAKELRDLDRSLAGRI